MTFFKSTLLLLSTAFLAQGAAFSTPSEVVSRVLASSDTGLHSELNLMLDFSTAEHGQLLESLHRRENVPVSLYSAEEMPVWTELRDPCPVFAEGVDGTNPNRIMEDSIFKRRRRLLSSEYLSRTLVVWVSSPNLRRALEILEGTAMWCHQYIDLGVFQEDSRFLFVLEEEEGNEVVFGSHLVQGHPHVATMVRTREHQVLFYTYNFYHETNGLPELNSMVFSIANVDNLHLDDLWNPQTTLGGKTFNVVSIPYAHYTLASWKENPASPLEIFEDRRGFSPSMIDVFRQRLNFSVRFYNPDPPFAYGDITKWGAWDGAIGLLFNGTCDFMADYSVNFEMSQGTQMVFYNMQDYEALASPRPSQYLKIDAIVSPFRLGAWAAIAGMVLLVAAVLKSLNHAEIFATMSEEKPLAFDRDFWLVAGALICQSV